MPNPNILRTLGPVQVEIKSTWAAAWVVRPNVIPINASLAAGGIGQFQFRVPYGYLKHPGETEFTNHDYTEIGREWVRVKRAPYTDDDIIFQGRIESDSRELHGPSTGDPACPAGLQTFTAYDGVQILNKRRISETVFQEFWLLFGSQPDEPTYATSAVIVPFNGHPNESRVIFGNMSTDLRDSGGMEHHVFQLMYDYGTPSPEWKSKDVLDYLFAEFLNGSGNPAIEPQWTVTLPEDPENPGEPDPWFNRVIGRVDLKTNVSILEVITEMFTREYGIGWAVIPRAAGFEFRMFTLTGVDVEYEDATVPANTNTLTFDTADPDLQIRIERSFVHSYGKLRVISKPMVVCFSPSFAYPRWTDAQLAAFGLLSHAEQQSGDHQTVLQEWEADPQQMLLLQPPPLILADGTIDDTSDGPTPQLHMSTLQTIPLVETYDYLNPPEGIPPPRNVLGLPPRIWMRGVDSKYVDIVCKAGASLYALPTVIGLAARVDDPGIFALDTSIEGAVQNPLYDGLLSTTMTVAYEAAQRLQIDYVIPGAQDCDGVFIVEEPTAEVWWLAAGTALKVGDDGSLVHTTAGLELRNDRDLLFRRMAGLIARYTQSRAKAIVRAQGLHMYSHFLGYMFAAVADGTDASEIAAPITGVQYQFEGDYATTLSTGYAI